LQLGCSGISIEWTDHKSSILSGLNR
jgi:hypothetical protein